MNFLAKLVSLRPGEAMKNIISDVMHGRAEGADISESEDEASSTRAVPKGIFGRVSFFISSTFNITILSILSNWLVNWVRQRVRSNASLELDTLKLSGDSKI